MADYDRRNPASRGNYNNNRKRRYRGIAPNQSLYLPGADLYLQMMMNMNADRSAEDTKNPCLSRCGSSYWESPNLYVHLVTNNPGLAL